ncbi:MULTISPECIES: L-aspartate oxidase [Desertifilum]|uniref:L-aspartate oxidase n=1 Tax=unclassified Desertifilum TaxID=2621682 RepID=UPI000AF512D0|nr:MULTISPECIES: L-aspartate oxidase [Desertifilum]MDA0210981.1 L-aspartate oxidase [Cyanobacteria bacterium FC1]
MNANIPQPQLSDLYDALVVGAGAAGLYAALCLPRHYRVGLISKDALALSASDWAQGGIAAAIAPEDSPELHIHDTLQAGAGLCDREAVEFLVRHAPHCIESLVNLGVEFDRHGTQLALTLEAAHSRRRVLHAADTTGRAVVSILGERVLSCPHITTIPEAFALSLWRHPQTGACQGVSVAYQGQIRWIRSKVVILATGGGGQVFAQTTNPALSTGDGVAIAYRAGALLRDLEFFQFHPTALTKPGAPHFLISEAVRGEGAHLVDAQGRRFAFDYHPQGELAPRDVVSRAIFSHLQVTSAPHVWLDLRPIPRETIQKRFPNIFQVCQHWGIDIFSQPIPVAPAAHYWMGGIATDLQSRTSIPGLYAVGETASTGVHGANRLASNSLLECVVFGAQLAHLELLPLLEDETTQQKVEVPLEALPAPAQLEAIATSLKALMWQSAGICRSAEVLESAIAKLSGLQQEFEQLPSTQFFQNLQPGTLVQFPSPECDRTLRLWGETWNLLEIGQLILKSAVFRQESRGGHYRSDFSQTSAAWQTHTLIQNARWWQSVPIPD